MNGKRININVSGEPVKGYLSLPSQSNVPGVLVLHAWWGLNPFFETLCDRLAVEGFAAFAPDLREGHIATTIEEAKQLINELDEMKNQAVVETAVAFLKDRSEVRKEALSVIGFSMGAGWSLEVAQNCPEDIRKITMFYGAGEADYSKFKADVLGHFAEKDEWEDEKYINAMKDEMQAAGLNVDFHFYPNTSHWFFEEDRPEFNVEAADLAWKRTLEFLRK